MRIFRYSSLNFVADSRSSSSQIDSQCGFRPERGTADATFSLKLALKKRREHNLETWVVFVDFVKAFDRVPRELLWETLARFGVPLSRGQSHSFASIRAHSPSFALIRAHSPSFADIRHHSPLFTLICSDSRSFALIRPHSRSFAIRAHVAPIRVQ